MRGSRPWLAIQASSSLFPYLSGRESETNPGRPLNVVFAKVGKENILWPWTKSCKVILSGETSSPDLLNAGSNSKVADCLFSMKYLFSTMDRPFHLTVASNQIFGILNSSSMATILVLGVPTTTRLREVLQIWCY